MKIQASDASTFAMQQAIQQPRLLIDLLQQSMVTETVQSKTTVPSPLPSPPPADGRGRLIDIRI